MYVLLYVSKIMGLHVEPSIAPILYSEGSNGRFYMQAHGGSDKDDGSSCNGSYTIILYIHVCRSMHDDDEQDKSQRNDYF